MSLILRLCIIVGCALTYSAIIVHRGQADQSLSTSYSMNTFRIAAEGGPTETLTGFKLSGLRGIITDLHGVADAYPDGVIVAYPNGVIRGPKNGEPWVLHVYAVDVGRDLALLSSPEFERDTAGAAGLTLSTDTSDVIDFGAAWARG